MIRNGIRRGRLLLVRAGRPALLALALVGLVAVGIGAANYADQPTTTVTDRHEEGTVRSGLSTSATVTGNSSLFENGTRMRDRSAYLVDSMPRVRLALETSVPDDRRVRVDHELVLVYRLVRDGETFWREERVLASERTTTDSGTARTTTTLDVRAVEDRVAQVRDEVGGGASVEVSVRAETAYEADGIEGTLNDSATVSVGNEWYSVGTPASERTHETTTERTVPVDHQSPLPYAGPAGLGVALLSLACLGAGLRRWGPDPAVDREAIHRERYAEWISTGTLPSSPGEEAVVVDSLEALVDVAIDTDGRVIHDPDRDWYVVIDGATRYWFPEGSGPDPARPPDDGDGERSGRGEADPRPTPDPAATGEPSGPAVTGEASDPGSSGGTTDPAATGESSDPAATRDDAADRQPERAAPGTLEHVGGGSATALVAPGSDRSAGSAPPGRARGSAEPARPGRASGSAAPTRTGVADGSAEPSRLGTEHGSAAPVPPGRTDESADPGSSGREKRADGTGASAGAHRGRADRSTEADGSGEGSAGGTDPGEGAEDGWIRADELTPDRDPASQGDDDPGRPDGPDDGSGSWFEDGSLDGDVWADGGDPWTDRSG